MLATVLEKAPQEYASILATEERRKGTALTLEDLEAAMDMKFRIRYGVRGTKRESKKVRNSLYCCLTESFITAGKRDILPEIAANQEKVNSKAPVTIVGNTDTKRPAVGS